MERRSNGEPTAGPDQDATVTRRQLVRRAAALGAAASALGGVIAAAWPGHGGTGATGAPTAAAGPSPKTNAAASPGASPVAAARVAMTSQLRFDPPAVTIKVGQTVTWTNASPIPHTTTDDPAKNPVAKTHPDYAALPAGATPWDSGLLDQGQPFSHTFTVPGVYKYFCIPHVLSGMRGMVTVEG